MTEDLVSPPRPLGVAILAVLHVLGGLGILTVQLFVQPRGVEEADQVMRNFGFTFEIALAAFAFLALLYLGSGIGLWLGKAWGWWTGAFAYVYRILASLNALITAFGYSAELAAETRGLAFYSLKFGARILVSVLILTYFFRPRVLSFFGLSEVRKLRSVGIMVAIYLVLALATTLVGSLLS